VKTLAGEKSNNIMNGGGNMEMEWNVILEFPDGHSEEATLARPFMPEENLVNVEGL
jgi:hypothetical protein